LTFDLWNATKYDLAVIGDKDENKAVKSLSVFFLFI